MTWEAVHNVKPLAVKADAVPDDGIRVSPRTLRRSKGGDPVKWINIQIGATLARKLSLVQPSIKVRILRGSGPDAGKIAISVDATNGDFIAKRQKKGGYFVAINAKSADGLFKMDFPAFTRPRIEAIRPTNGQPVMCCFPVDTAMIDRDGLRSVA